MDNFEWIKSLNRQQMALFIQAVKKYGLMEKAIGHCDIDCPDTSSPQYRKCLPCIEAYLNEEYKFDKK